LASFHISYLLKSRKRRRRALVLMMLNRPVMLSLGESKHAVLIASGLLMFVIFFFCEQIIAIVALFPS
jgi:hypothetical protein